MKCPSRCVDCGSRMLHVAKLISDTFDQPHICGWQCVACGLVMETRGDGPKLR